MIGSPRIILTGAKGFVGSKLKSYFDSNGQFISELTRDKHSLFETSSLKDLLVDADIIYHLAGRTAGSGHNPGRAALLRNNIEATFNLLNAIKEFCKKPPLLINMSSIHVYDKSTPEITEDSKLEPSNIYGITKLSQEYLIRQATKNGLVRSVIFRASNIYGGGHRPYHNSAISTFCHNIKKNLPIDLYANGKATIDLIYIDDVIDVLANIDTIEKHNGNIYNLASGQTITIQEVIDILEKISGQKIKTNLIDGKEHSFRIITDKLIDAYPNYKNFNIYDGLENTYRDQL